MNDSAFFTMIAAQGLVTLFTVYFFVLVLLTPPRQEPDSFEENDERD
jgi:hypothetical protein